MTEWWRRAEFWYTEGMIVSAAEERKHNERGGFNYIQQTKWEIGKRLLLSNIISNTTKFECLEISNSPWGSSHREHNDMESLSRQTSQETVATNEKWTIDASTCSKRINRVWLGECRCSQTTLDKGPFRSCCSLLGGNRRSLQELSLSWKGVADGRLWAETSFGMTWNAPCLKNCQPTNMTIPDDETSDGCIEGRARLLHRKRLKNVNCASSALDNVVKLLNT
jgi:hypothetical protein